MQMESAKEVEQHPEYKKALVELLYQLADDNFIMGYRGSEWLGLAPHLEADVAFCSIAQDHVGHAALYYQLLEELGEGKADDIAHLRTAKELRNAVLVERANGTGEYMENPQYDWAYAVVRQWVYDLFETVRVTALTTSSYKPLAQVAQKMCREKPYHHFHGETWIRQMATTTTEAKTRLQDALQKVWADVDGLFQYGEQGKQVEEFGLQIKKEQLYQRFAEQAKRVLEQYDIAWLGDPAPVALNGREGEHTEELEQALATLSEVYRQDPAANW